MRYAVSHMDWLNDRLITEIISADSWRQALSQHSKIGEKWLEDSPTESTLEDIKSFACDRDCMIEVVEIPD